METRHRLHARWRRLLRNSNIVIAKICSDDDLQSEAAAEQDLDSLALKERDFADELQADVDSVSLLLTELELSEQDDLQRLLPISDHPDNIPDHILFPGDQDE